MKRYPEFALQMTLSVSLFCLGSFQALAVEVDANPPYSWEGTGPEGKLRLRFFFEDPTSDDQDHNEVSSSGSEDAGEATDASVGTDLGGGSGGSGPSDLQGQAMAEQTQIVLAPVVDAVNGLIQRFTGQDRNVLAEYEAKVYAYDSFIRQKVPNILSSVNERISTSFEIGFYDVKIGQEQLDKIEEYRAAAERSEQLRPSVVIQKQPLQEDYRSFLEEQYSDLADKLENISREWNGDGNFASLREWHNGPQFTFDKNDFLETITVTAFNINKKIFEDSNLEIALAVEGMGSVLDEEAARLTFLEDDIAVVVRASESRISDLIRSSDPVLTPKLKDINSRLRRAEPQTSQQEAARRIGLDAVQVADEALLQGDREQAEFALSVAETMLDVTTGFLPGISWIRDVYEATTGNDMITGRNLSTFERTAAALGACAGPIGGQALNVIRRIKGSERLGEVLRDAERIIEKARDTDSLSPKTISKHANDRLEEIAQETSRSLDYVKDRVEVAFDEGVRYWDKKDRTILFAERSWESSSVGRLAPAVEINTDTVTTINRNFPSDDAAVAIQHVIDGVSVPRYRRIPDVSE